MELGNPLRSLLGRAPADVLRVMSRVEVPLIGRRIAQLAGLPKSSASRALQHLEQVGLVEAEQIGRSRRYSVNREHLLWPAVQTALESEKALRVRIAQRAQSVDGVSTLLYGSMARGDADAQSDVDLLLVHEDDVPSEQIDRLIDDLRSLVRQASGNDAEVYVVSASDLHDAVVAREPIVESWRKDAQLIAGPPVELVA